MTASERQTINDFALHVLRNFLPARKPPSTGHWRMAAKDNLFRPEPVKPARKVKES